jgi:DNA topoisomerase I
MKKLVIVESQSKAKALARYLGESYEVLASNGHIRSLPSKNGAVDVNNHFQMDWDLLDKSKKNLSLIEQAVKRSSSIILATDPDREGEAISWHLLEHLKNKGLLKKDKQVERVTFNAVTKQAVLEALKNPRQIDQHLVDAYLARLSLDYLVGFNLSPVLWRKLPGSRSAGRVQSVALRLIVDREAEILAFESREFWTIQANFETPKKNRFQGQLVVWQNKKLEKFSIPDQAAAENIIKHLKVEKFAIDGVEKKRTLRHPTAPFITSTLQQEASKRLGLSPAQTMRLAQGLYEGVEIQGENVGLITYLRTDSVHIIPEVLADLRQYIEKSYGKEYVSSSQRQYKTKVRNAQEAHEAIRPTSFEYAPEKLRGILSPEHWALYDLIWRRTLASQMASAQYDQTTVMVSNGIKDILFKATGSELVFDGFLKMYLRIQEDSENLEEETSGQNLFSLEQGMDLRVLEWIPQQHMTQPPPRFNDASLVKQLEELGIGRPSTYAYILQILQDRDYVKREKKVFQPSHKGVLVSLFLKKFFGQYVEEEFTARLEERLDDVSGGKVLWGDVLDDFWGPFHQNIQESEKLKISEVLESVETDLFLFLFSQEKADFKCGTCPEGRMRLRLGRYGPFLSCSNYPDCRNIRNLDEESRSIQDGSSMGTGVETDEVFGIDPKTQENIHLKKGPFGYYLEWEQSKQKASVPKHIPPSDITMEDALLLRQMPIGLGEHPQGGAILIGAGRFGPYLKYKDRFFSIKNRDDFWRISLEEALDLIQKAGDKKPARGRFAKKESLKTPEKKPLKGAEGSAPPKKKTVAKKSVQKTKVVKKTKS